MARFSSPTSTKGWTTFEAWTANCCCSKNWCSIRPGEWWCCRRYRFAASSTACASPQGQAPQRRMRERRRSKDGVAFVKALVIVERRQPKTSQAAPHEQRSPAVTFLLSRARIAPGREARLRRSASVRCHRWWPAVARTGIRRARRAHGEVLPRLVDVVLRGRKSGARAYRQARPGQRVLPAASCASCSVAASCTPTPRSDR